MSYDKISIGIIGGGLGGLAAALALQRDGHEVLVFERDKEFSDRKQGYGLTLTNNPKGPLAKLGILDEVLANDCHSNQHWVFKPCGKLIGYYGRALLHTTPTDGPRGNIRIPRQVLRRILLDKLKPNTIHWNRTIKSYQEDSEGVSLYVESKDNHINNPFTNDQEMSSSTCTSSSQIEKYQVDILIGADGLNSTIRKTLHLSYPDVVPSSLRYVGVSVIIGLSRIIHPLCTKGGYYVLDGICHRLFVMPFRDGLSSSSTCTCMKQGYVNSDCICVQTNTCPLTMWQLSFSNITEDEGLKLKNSSSMDLKKEALRRTQNWFNAVQQMIEETESKDIWATPLYDRDPMTFKSKKFIQSHMTTTTTTVIKPKSPKLDRNDINDNIYDKGINNSSSSKDSLHAKKQRIQCRNNQIEANVSNGMKDHTGPSINQSIHNNNKSLMNNSESSELNNIIDMKQAANCTIEVIKCPKSNHKSKQQVYSRKVTVIGDACHPMSMFKGQGCNQAMEDGPLLSAWLSRPGLNKYTNLSIRLRCFEREMIQRSNNKVLASRDAADKYHSESRFMEISFGYEGIEKENEVKQFEEICEKEGVNASMGGQLECTVRRIIQTIRDEKIDTGTP